MASAQPLMDMTIKAIFPQNKFNIIQTKDDLYYCCPGADDTEYTPVPLGLSKHADTITIHTTNKHYWGYSLLGNRGHIYFYNGSNRVFEFEEPALKLDIINTLHFLKFYVLNDRWIVSIIEDTRVRNIIVRTQDMLQQHPAKTHTLSGLRIDPNNSHTRTQTFSDDTNYIIIYTPTKIAKIMVCPDDGDRITRLDYKLTDNNITFVNRHGHYTEFGDISFSICETPITKWQPMVPEPVCDGKPVIMVYYEHICKRNRIHTYLDGPVLIGTINPDTLENVFIHDWQDKMNNPDYDAGAKQFIEGTHEYLAPDIIIQRPNFTYDAMAQYLVLLTPDARQIRVNMHEYVANREQRDLYYVLQSDTGRFFTLIYRTFNSKARVIYQIDRVAQTITHNLFESHCRDVIYNTTSDGRIVCRRFELTGNIIRIIRHGVDLSEVLPQIPATVCVYIARFMKQKTIHY